MFFSITGSLTYSTSNTNSATINTINSSTYLLPGQVVSVGTCNITGGSGTGDTFLRLYNPSGVAVASNDDGGGSCGLLSNLTYTVPSDGAGAYQIRAGCFSSTSCSGTVANFIYVPLIL
jgi:hypothetical protein